MTDDGGTILGHLYRTAGVSALGGLTDAELLRRSLAGPAATAEAAFAVLLTRHGPMVLRTCRATLRDPHDADDAFQATFLVLARKARTMTWRNDLGPWLYEVARRVSAHARSTATRRAVHERQAAEAKAAATPSQESDVEAVVHDAVGRLPSRFRSAVVLCDLEGLSYQEAAGRLGWTLATVRNRLARGRQRLRTALERVGLAPSAVAGVAPVVPRDLAAATARAAANVVAGATAGAASDSVMLLVTGGLQAMFLAKLQTVGLIIVTATVLVAGAYGLSAQAPGEKTDPSRPAADPPPGQSAATDPNRPTAAPIPPAAPAPMRAVELVAKLTAPTDLDKSVENVPLRDMLEMLSEKYGVMFVIDVQAFERDNGNRTVEDTQVRLAKMTGVTLQTVLRHVLGQVQGTVLVRSDHLAVVPLNTAMLEAHATDRLTEDRVIQPIIHVACDRKPLEQVLADVAKQSSRNIVLDPGVTDRDKLTVTANLLNTPADTAVRVLAELVNLKVVRMDNVFFVTTRVRATELTAEEEKLVERRRRDLQAATEVKPTPPTQPKP